MLIARASVRGAADGQELILFFPDRRASPGWPSGQKTGSRVSYKFRGRRGQAGIPASAREDNRNDGTSSSSTL
jgi:hypothetical protein